MTADAREICLALATVCEKCREWEGARILRRVAERLYNQHYEYMAKCAGGNTASIRAAMAQRTVLAVNRGQPPCIECGTLLGHHQGCSHV